MEHLCVGVDAGGSTTTASFSKNGSFVRTSVGAAANVAVLGVPAAADAIASTVRTLVGSDTVDALCVGAAGVGAGDGARALERALALAFPHAHVAVTEDAEIAFRTAVPEGSGIVAIAGTGSIALAIDGANRVRVGGLGYLAGDEGSAFAIGMAAVRLLGRAYDGRAPRDETTDLASRTLEAPDRATLLAALYGGAFAPGRVAALAPAIVAFAGKGNRPSTKIVQEAAKEFGELVKACARLAGMLESSPTVVLGGGLFRENSMYTFLAETRIVGDIPGVAIVRLTDDPSRGALRMAEAARTAA